MSGKHFSFTCKISFLQSQCISCIFYIDLLKKKKKLTLQVKRKCFPTISPHFSSLFGLPTGNPCYLFGVCSSKTFVCQAFVWIYVTTLRLQCARVQPHPWACSSTQTEHKTETVTLSSVSEGTLQTALLVSHEIGLWKQHLIHDNIQNKITLLSSMPEEIRLLCLSDFESFVF